MNDFCSYGVVALEPTTKFKVTEGGQIFLIEYFLKPTLNWSFSHEMFSVMQMGFVPHEQKAMELFSRMRWRLISVHVFMKCQNETSVHYEQAQDWS